MDDTGRYGGVIHETVAEADVLTPMESWAATMQDLGQMCEAVGVEVDELYAKIAEAFGADGGPSGQAALK